MKKFIRILGICYLVYLIIVLVIVTPALNLLPSWAVKKYLGRDLESGFNYFNPFTLSLEVGKTAIPEHDGSPFVSLDHATINISTASLWSRALVFDKIGVEQLFVHVKELPDGTFNFSDMLPPDDNAPEEQTDEGITPLTIDELDFNARQLIYSNEAREKPTSNELNDLNINVLGLSTVLEEGKPYVLDAKGERGGELHWKGVVSIPSSYSEGELSLTNIQLIPLWTFIEPWVAFRLDGGALGLQGQYAVSWADEVDYSVTEGKFTLDEVAIVPQSESDIPDTSIALGNLTIDGIALDGSEQQVDVASFSIDELAIAGWSEGEQVSLVDLFATDLPAEDAATAPANDEEEAEENPWSASLGRFSINNSSVRWRSEYTDPAELNVSPITVSAQTLAWPLEGTAPLSLALTVNGQTSASVDGEVDLGEGAGQLAYRLQALSIPWFNPNLPEGLNGEFTGGELEVQGEVTLAEFAPTSVAMDGAVTGFAASVTEAETSLTSWETVRWDKLLVDLNAQKISMEKLAIDNFIGRFHINEDGSINASNAFKSPDAEEAGQDTDESIEQPEEEASEDAGQPWFVSIPLIHISDSQIDFKDESLPIEFRTVIGELNGDIKNISSEEGVNTEVELKGSVDGYAPVNLTGTAQPLAAPIALDLLLTFDGMDMSRLTPYSGTYAGRAIEQGVLNLDLNYAMADNQLQGKNKIVIEQMKLGEKVESEKAVDLPLDLALALLTDTNGVIDMDVPVSGDVTDPEFSVGSVVMGALVNLITKAVTSPFTLLASLVDSEEDLQRINFSSGSDQLEEHAQEKLTTLSTALVERPELALTITGRLQLEADTERMQKNQLQAELVAAGLSQQEADSRGPDWEEAIKQRYQASSPGETDKTVREQYLALAATIPIAETALLELAAERALVVKTYLVNEAGLAPERAVIAQADLAPEDNQYSGVELAIDI
ncbi:MAG: DUF748 domain-containing protein [Pseudomonadota bacterium]